MIDKEQIQSQVRHLAEEARDNQPQRLKSFEELGEATGRTAAPIVMAKEHDVIPSGYVLHYSLVQCRNCGSAVRPSQFFALVYLRSRMTGKRVRQLIPCATPMYNVPVEKILTGCSHTPYCQSCDTIDLSHLPPPPQADQVYDLAEPTAKGAKTKASGGTKKAEPKAASLDDLI